MKMTFRFAFKTSFGHLQDVLARCLACLGKTSLRHLEDVHLQDVHLQDVHLVHFCTYVLYYCLNSMEAVTVFAKKLHHRCSSGVPNTPPASLECVSYLAISMIIATLASCDQVIF